MVNYLVTIVCVCIILREKENRDFLFPIVSFSSIVLIAIGCYQYANIDELKVEKFLQIQAQVYVEAFFANKNLFADVLVLLLPFNLINSINNKNRYIQLVAIAAIIGTGFLLIIIQSKLSFLAIALAGIATILAFFLTSKSISKSLKVAISAITSLGVIGIFSFLLIKLSHIEGMNQLFDKSFIELRNIENSYLERIIMYRNSILMTMDHFWSGIGIGNWNIIVNKYGIGGADFLNEGTVKFQRPHNDFLLSLSELGIFGLGAYLAVFYFLFKAVITSLRQELSKEEHYLNLTILFGLVAYIVISSFNFPKERIYIHLLFILLIGLSNRSENVFENRALPNKGILTSLIAILIFGNFWIYNRLNNEETFYKASILYHDEQYQNVLRVLEKIDRNYLTIDQTATPLDWYVGQCYFRLGQTEKALQSFLKAKEYNPYNNNVLNDIASCYEIMRNHENAKLYYKGALNIYPKFSTTLLNLSIVYSNQQDFDKALEYIQQIEYPFAHEDQNFIRAASNIVGYYVFQANQQTSEASKKTKLALLQASPQKKANLLVQSIQEKKDLNDLILKY